MNAPMVDTTPSTSLSAYLTGRHAVITGASRGIGAVLAESLARLGARVTLMARTRETAEAVEAKLRESLGAECAFVACDVSVPSSVEAAFATAGERFGAPYILVNNAGQSDSASFEETSMAAWDRLLSVNLTGTFLCTQQVTAAMRKARAGRIINIASTAGLRGYSHTAAYCASKHGVIGLTRALAMETAKAGITVNAVCPGYTDTDMLHSAVNNLMKNLGKTEEEARKMLVRGNPRGVVTTAAEVANAVAWLCSPDATAVTGQAIAVAGGEVM